MPQAATATPPDTGQDWFSQNAPSKVTKPPSSGDWFADNAPSNLTPKGNVRPSEAELAASVAPSTAAAARRGSMVPMDYAGMEAGGGGMPSRATGIPPPPAAPIAPGTTMAQDAIRTNKPYAKWEGAGALTAAAGSGIGVIPAALLAMLGGAGGEAAQQIGEHAITPEEAPKTSAKAAGRIGLAGGETGATELALGTGGKLIEGVAKKYADPLANAIQKIFKASGPPADPAFRDSVSTAAADLKAIYDAHPINESQRGGIINPDKRLRDTIGNINDYLADMYHTERAGQIGAATSAGAHGPVAGVPADTLQFVVTKLSRELPLDTPERAVAKKLAENPTADLTIAEIDSLQKAVGAELRQFKTKGATQQAAARSTSKVTAGYESFERGAKQTLDDLLKQAGQPGLADYNKRYAALTDVRDALEKRMNPAEANQFLDKIHEFMGTHGISARVSTALGQSPGRNLETGLKGLSEHAGAPARALPKPPPHSFDPAGPAAAQALPPPPPAPPPAPVGTLPPAGFPAVQPLPDPHAMGKSPDAMWGAKAVPISSSEGLYGEAAAADARRRAMEGQGKLAPRSSFGPGGESRNIIGPGTNMGKLPPPPTRVSEANVGGASREAATAVANDAGQGITRFRRDTRTGAETKLSGVDMSRDPYMGPHDELFYRDANGVEHPIDRGAKAIPVLSNPARGPVGVEFKRLGLTNLVTKRQQATLDALVSGPRYKSMDAVDKAAAIKAVLQGK